MNDREELEATAAKLDEDRKAIQAHRLRMNKELQQRNAELAVERAKAEEAEKVRRAEQQLAFIAREAERERIADERMPDREKLKGFVRRIDEVKIPRLGTVWGNGVFNEMCEYIQRVHNLAYQLPSDGQLTEDDSAVQIMKAQKP